MARLGWQLRGVRWVLGSAVGLVGLAAAVWTAPRWFVPLLVRGSHGCLYAVPTQQRAVALTFDDGPDSATTSEILRVLRAHGARATFFLISSRVPGRESVVADIVAEGHELGNHLTQDEASILLSREAFSASVWEAGIVLGQFGPARWLRPGSGWYTPAMLATIEREGYRCALGSVYPYDAHVPATRFAAAYILANTRPGAVIVLHDGGARGWRTVEVLERVLPVLTARGYRLLTLSDLDVLAEVADTSNGEDH